MFVIKFKSIPQNLYLNSELENMIHSQTNYLFKETVNKMDYWEFYFLIY